VIVLRVVLAWTLVLISLHIVARNILRNFRFFSSNTYAHLSIHIFFCCVIFRFARNADCNDEPGGFSVSSHNHFFDVYFSSSGAWILHPGSLPLYIYSSTPLPLPSTYPETSVDGWFFLLIPLATACNPLYLIILNVS